MQNTLLETANTGLREAGTIDSYFFLLINKNLQSPRSLALPRTWKWEIPGCGAWHPYRCRQNRPLAPPELPSVFVPDPKCPGNGNNRHPGLTYPDLKSTGCVSGPEGSVLLPNLPM